MCAETLTHAIADRGVRTLPQSEPNANSGRKIPCRTGESNLRPKRAGPEVQATELHPRPIFTSEIPIVKVVVTGFLRVLRFALPLKG